MKLGFSSFETFFFLSTNSLLGKIKNFFSPLTNSFELQKYRS